MKRLLLLAAAFMAIAFLPVRTGLSTPHAHPSVQKLETYVYICDSKTAYAYHSTRDCRGLRNCTHQILKVTLSDAVNYYHRRPCKICER